MTKVKMYNTGDGLKFEGFSDDPVATEATFKSLQRNGTFMPGIKEVVINTPEDGSKQGSVQVRFKDGSKVLVKNTDKDTFSPELGLVYALVKRMFGLVKDNNSVSSGSYMNKINKILENAKYPREEAAAKAAKEKADAEAKAKADADAKDARRTEMKELIKEALAELGVKASESLVGKVAKSVKKAVKTR